MGGKSIPNKTLIDFGLKIKERTEKKRDHSYNSSNNVPTRLKEIFSNLLTNIGKGSKTSNENYKFIMENLPQIPEYMRIDFQAEVVKYLLSLKSQTIFCPREYIDQDKNAHIGEYFEYYIGLSQNPVELGDLLGLEMKVWAGKSQLSIKTYSVEKDLEEFVGSKMSEILCAKDKTGTHCTGKECRDPKHILKMSEGIAYDNPNVLGKLKYNIDDKNNLRWFLKRNSDWSKFASTNILEKLQKYHDGLLLVIINGERSEKKCQLQDIFYIPITPMELVLLIKENKVNYEIRYRKDKHNGTWDGISFHNTGWGFRLKPSWVRKNWMIPKYCINSVGDFEKLRIR